MADASSSEPPPTSQRAQRVKALFDDVIANVIESLKDDAQLDGLDERVLMQLKEVTRTRTRPHTRRARARSSCARVLRCARAALTRPLAPRVPQRWYAKLREHGAFAEEGETNNLERRVGAGRTIVPAQYLPPQREATAAQAASTSRSANHHRGGQHPTAPGPAPGAEQQPSQSSAPGVTEQQAMFDQGYPLGSAEFYGTAPNDGLPGVSGW